MISKWFSLKDKAIRLRKSGRSIKDVENMLGIPRSTLSGWFRNIELTVGQRKALDKRWRRALVYARTKSVIWHNTEKQKRMKLAEDDALKTLSKLDIKDKNILELALSMLYLGEGFKNNDTGIGNSNLEILKFFIKCVEELYSFPRINIKCYLHLRADQNVKSMKKYWSKNLGIPLKNFMAASLDKRTVGRKTYKDYKGVCLLMFGNIAIQRKLLYLSREFSRRIIEN